MKQKIISTVFLFFIGLLQCAAQNVVDTLVGIDVRAGKDIPQTVHKLCDGVASERLKANAIFNWITHHISFDVIASKTAARPRATPDETFRNKTGTADDYALLFAHMCKEAGLPAVVIEGYTHEWFYDKGDMLMLPHHAWNAVLINGKWELADAAFGAGYVALKKQNNRAKQSDGDNAGRFWEKYSTCFIADAPTFRITHLPADPFWQLTEHIMPVETFEKGELAVQAYNAQYIFDIKRDNPELMKIARMSRDERMQHYADRAYKYNANYLAVLGIKETVSANQTLQQYYSRDTRNNYLNVLDAAKEKLNKALEHHKGQYKLFAPYYAELDKKSLQKNKDEKTYTRDLRMTDRQLQPRFERYRDAAARTAQSFQTKDSLAKLRTQYLSEDSILRVKKALRIVPATELQKLADSIQLRNTRIELINAKLNAIEGEVLVRANEYYTILQQRVATAITCDSILDAELTQRKRLYDNNDTQVIACMLALKQVRKTLADSVSLFRLQEHDSIVKMQDNLLKQYMQVMDMHRSNIKDMEQYRKGNDTDSALAERYAATVQQYTSTVNRYCEIAGSYAAYQNNNAEQYGRIAALYDNEMKMLDEIDAAEDERNALERREITDHKLFDEQQSLRLQADVQNQLKEIEKLIVIESAKY